MTGRSLLARGAVLLAALGFVAVHGLILYRGASLEILPGAIVSGMIVLAVIKHLGLLGGLGGLIWRRLRSRRRP